MGLFVIILFTFLIHLSSGFFHFPKHLSSSFNVRKSFNSQFKRDDSGRNKATYNHLSDMLETSVDEQKPKFIFVGGKGGVGKTSTSGALAIACSDANLHTLIISTDPAHSLGDALDMQLNGQPSLVDDTKGLYAMEVDALGAMVKLKKKMASFDLSKLGINIDGEENQLSQFTLSSLSEVFQNPPPGFDELLALHEVITLAKMGKYDRIIIDTAPTGHTLRLLAAPKFLDIFLEKVDVFKLKLENMLGLGAGLLGFKAEPLIEKLNEVAATLNSYRRDMVELSSLFQNPNRTEFVMVSSPNTLALLESRSLMKSLKENGISVRNVVANKILPLDRSRDDQILSAIQKSENESIERARQGSLEKLAITEVPLLSCDMHGMTGLHSLSQAIFKPASSPLFDGIVAQEERRKQKLILFGGKGGVGKTSSSAATALTCARQGLRTVIVSTDPAHSLGDAFGVDLTSQITEIKNEQLLPQEGMLFGMEVDTKESSEELKTLIRTASSPDDENLLIDPEDLNQVFENLPPGVDEMIAITKVLTLLNKRSKNGDMFYDRIIIDTAPTGHTLRLLAAPKFLESFLERVVEVRSGFKNIMAKINRWFSAIPETDSQASRDQLIDLQIKMFQLEEKLTDRTLTQFVIVTIATKLALSESERLASSITKIPVNHLIINQLIRDTEAGDSLKSSYLHKLRESQSKHIYELKSLAKAYSPSSKDGLEETDIGFTEVPWLEDGVVGVTALREMASLLISKTL